MSVYSVSNKNIKLKKYILLFFCLQTVQVIGATNSYKPFANQLNLLSKPNLVNTEGLINADSTNKYIDSLLKLFVNNPNSRKGNLYLQLSLPYVNNFVFKPDYETYKTNTGFLGISGGLNYYHKKNQFITLSVAGVMDFFVPVPAPVHYSGEREHMFSSFIYLSNNHKIRWLTLGYGFAYASNTWNFVYHGGYDSLFPPTRDPAYRTNKAIGLIFPIHLELGEFFYSGVIYRPTFYRFSAVQLLTYEHLISLELGIRVPLNNYKRFKF